MNTRGLFFILTIVAALSLVSMSGNKIDPSSGIEKRGNQWTVTERIDLQGTTLNMPRGCVLSFNGKGQLANGTVKADCGQLDARRSSIFQNIKIEGTWRVQNIYSAWFAFSPTDADLNTRNFRSMCALSDDNTVNTLHIARGTYPINIKEVNGEVFTLRSNTTLKIDGKLQLQANNHESYAIVRADQKHDITLCGKGQIIGDVATHRGKKGEWGMGISLLNCKHAIIRDLTIKNCWGDCIYIGQHQRTKSDYCEDVLIENVTCDAGRRQGLSLIAGKDILITQSRFQNTGSIKFTWPGAGIDIEPNSQETTVDNVVIDRCRFKNNNVNFHGDILFTNIPTDANVTVKQCTGLKKVSVRSNAYGIHLQDCSIDTLLIANQQANANITTKKCKTKVLTHHQR